MSPNMTINILISTGSWCSLLCCVRTKPRQTTMESNIPVYIYSHSARPTVSWIHITRKARNSVYLLRVKNTLQKYINVTRVPRLLHDLPLASNSLFLLYQLLVTSYALKSDTSFTSWKDIGHETIQENSFSKISRVITMSTEVFHKFQLRIKHIQSKTTN